MADINIPGIGTVSKRNAAIFAGITALILGVAYWRHRAGGGAAPASSSTDTASTYQPDSSYDPVGVGYSNAFGPTGYDIYGNPLATPTQVGGVTVSGGTYATNNEWATAAETALYDGPGIATATSGAAISRVLAGLAVTTEQKNIFLQATGLLGQPPQGYPQPIHVSDPVSPTKPPAATKPGKPGGLHVAHVGRTDVRVAWSASKGATSYIIRAEGRQVATTSSTSYTLTGLKPHTRYSIGVIAHNAAGSSSMAVVHVGTHK